MFREYSELSGGPFPAKLDMVSLLQVVMTKKILRCLQRSGQKPSAKQMQEITEAAC